MNTIKFVIQFHMAVSHQTEDVEFMSNFSEMRKLFKGAYKCLDFPLSARTIQVSKLFEGVYYLRKYGI